MKLCDNIKNIYGLRFIIDCLDIKSPVGYEVMLDTELMCSQEDLNTYFDLTDKFVKISGSDLSEKIKIRLSEIRNIKNTIKNIENGFTLDDIELFEIKSFCIIAEEIKKLLDGTDIITFPSLNKVISILDPQDTLIPSFYIYNEYSDTLKQIRNSLKTCFDDNQRAILEEQASDIEDKVREELSGKLYNYTEIIKKAYSCIALTDISLAKAELSIKLGLTRPAFNDSEITFKGLFNPQIKQKLKDCGKDFQPVDINLEQQVTILTGANMSGKTVLLKTIALAQILCQYGFFVPAESAKLILFDEIFLNTGDQQNELQGLSSFAAEMIKINSIVNSIRNGRKVLALIDEPARTTNPKEGKSIVCAMISFLNRTKTISLISTHYSNLNTDSKRLKIKGFIEDKMTDKTNVDNINDCMDYSVIEDNERAESNDALKIASILGIDNEIINLAKDYYKLYKHE